MDDSIPVTGSAYIDQMFEDRNVILDHFNFDKVPLRNQTIAKYFYDLAAIIDLTMKESYAKDRILLHLVLARDIAVRDG